MPQRVVDVFEPVEVDDADRHRMLLGRGGYRVVRPLLEQHPVRQLGERVVGGEKRIRLHLTAQAPARRERDREQDDVQDRKTVDEVVMQAVQSRRDVGLDRRVGQVHLEDSHGVLGLPGPELLVDLHDRRVIGKLRMIVGVQRRQARDDSALRRVDGFVVDRTVRSRRVAGEHDVPAEVAQAQPEHFAIGDRSPDLALQSGFLARSQVRRQVVPFEQRLDRGSGDQSRLRTAFRETSMPGLGAVRAVHHQSEDDHRHDAEQRAGQESQRVRTGAAHPGPAHSLLIGQDGGDVEAGMAGQRVL